MKIDNLRDKLRERFATVKRPVEVIPAPKNKPSGTYQHFDTEDARQQHLKEIADNTLPF